MEKTKKGTLILFHQQYFINFANEPFGFYIILHKKSQIFYATRATSKQNRWKLQQKENVNF